MNKEVNLSITTLNVEVKVLALDGKRFTKSVFDQLMLVNYLTIAINPSVQYIGWVNLDDKWPLFVVDGTLFKLDISAISAYHDPDVLDNGKDLSDFEQARAEAVIERKLYDRFGLEEKDQIFISI